MTEAEMTKTELKSKSLEIEDFLPEWVKEFKRILEEAESVGGKRLGDKP